MYLHKLLLTNFKNYEEAALSFSDKINCFIGDNGVGKTNLLDAVYYLSFCKSYFNPLDTQNIRHDQGFFAIHGNYRKNSDHTDKVSCIQKTNQKKQFKLNQKDYDRLADHIGLFPLVMVSPYDSDLINDGSDVRRKFMDGVIAQFDKIYLDDLLKYNKALLQRNILLKNIGVTQPFEPSALDSWDKILADIGKKLHAARKEFIIKFQPVFQEYFEYISGGKEQVSVTYESQLHEHDLAMLLSSSREKDRVLKYTSMGTHKDDLIFELSGRPLKKYGSQGQQKSFLIAIKLAEFDYIKNIKGFKPILLFDDIFDKLDDFRVQQIIKLVSHNNFGQVFITDTQRQRIEMLFRNVDIDHKIFEVVNGTIHEIKW